MNKLQTPCVDTAFENIRTSTPDQLDPRIVAIAVATFEKLGFEWSVSSGYLSRAELPEIVAVLNEYGVSATMLEGHAASATS
jgi:hypothetical protein